MRKFIYLIVIGTSFISCGQNKKYSLEKTSNNSKTMYDINLYLSPEAKEINVGNFVSKLNSQIKHYDSEPMYYFRINKQNCLVEVYVNDVINNYDYELSNVITPINIFPLLKSGAQKVTVKMYPVGNLINQDLGLENQSPATIMSAKAQVDIEVVMMDNKSAKDFSDEKRIIKKISPKEVAGKQSYEFSFNFDAQIPYEFEGWTMGQDLRKLDQKLVLQKALEFYKMVGEMYVNKDLESRLKMVYPSTKRIQQTLYKSSNAENILQEYKSNVTGYQYKIPKIENYKVEFMGNGKLVALITNSDKSDYRGGSALMLKDENGDIYQPGITLYLPEGRDLATQGFMMWK